jgi:hypothetical protein
LSHSSTDKPFINRLNEDLKKCRIDTWIDEVEIRDGKPWLKVIFENGIPACHCVIVYLTEHSLKSKVVEKEIDAALIYQLGDSGVAFLPYVESTEIRGRLRLDLQSLHCRVWNDSNYQALLPTVVAEIWCSYFERVINTAVLQEKNKRLELELELSRLKKAQEASIFTPQEEIDFNYIKAELDQPVEVRLEVDRKTERGTFKANGQDVFEVNILDLVMRHWESGGLQFNGRFEVFATIVEQAAKADGYPKSPSGEVWKYFDSEFKATMLTRLLTCGIISPKKTEPGQARIYNVYKYAEKMFRFSYWMKYKKYYNPSFKIAYLRYLTQAESSRQSWGAERL